MLILKQNAANSVPTPPSGKGTIFLDDSDTLSVKTSDGNVETFPTVAASNAQVVFINGTALSGEAAFTYDFNNNVLNVTGNIAAGNVKTDNLLYANGTAWDLSDPGGSNTQIQFNDDESFGGSAAFTFDKSSNLVTVSANLNANNLNATTHITAGNVWANSGTISAQTLKGEAGNLSNITGANVTGAVAYATTANAVAGANVSGQVGNALVAGTVYTNAQPNITSVGTLTNLAVSGNAIISGNLTVDGNLVYVNVETVAVEDPIIQLQTGPNGATPSSNSGKDVGTALNYYDSQARLAFMGWDVSNAEFAFGSQTSITNEVVTFNTLGNARAQTFKGNVEASGTSNIADVNLAGHIIPTLDSTYDLGNATNRFRDLWISGNSIRIGNSTIKSNATSLILTNPDGGQIVVSGNSVSSTTSIVNGNSNVNIPSANGNVNISATGVANVVVITSTGANITGTLNVSANSNVTNLGASGVITATGTGTFGNVYANSGTIGASLLTGTLTTASQPNITTVGTLGNLSVTSNITAGNVKTDNLLYANGNPWDLSDPGGSNTQIQFNDDESFGGSAAFTFDKSSNLVTVGANLNANNLNATTHVTAGNVWANSGTIGASLLTGTLTTASQPNITSVGTLSSLTVTGNGIFGNVYANSGTIGASLLTGTLTTAAQPNVTSVGTLTSLAVTGNATAGNVYANSGTIGASLLTGTLTTAAQPNVTSVGTLTSLAVTGNTTAGNVYANSGTIGALTLKGEGGNISNVAAGNITGQVANALVAGTVYTAAQPNITSVGTLSSVTVSGNANVGNLGTAQVLASANVTAPQFISNIATGTAPLVVSSTTKVANLNADLLDGLSTATAATGDTVVIRDTNGSFSANVVTANLSGNATTAGTVVTAAQPNITSVGTLSSLAVTGTTTSGNFATAGNLTASFIVSNVATGTAPLTVTSTTRVANLNVDYANVADNINVTTQSSGNAYLVFANALTGNVSETANAVFVANTSNGALYATTFVGALSGAATSATTAGTVTTAAQPNITSVGTLTSLGVNGTVTAVAFTANTGVFTGNGSGLSAIAGANVTGQVANALVAGTVYTAAQPNITSVGTLSSLAVTGNVAAGNLTTTGVLSVTGTGVSSIAGNLDMTSNNIINLAAPVNANDAATKQYVDDVAQGLHTHDTCNAATENTLAILSGGTVTYNNGSSGVGATLTTTGSYTTIDGVTLSNGMRILVKNEANSAHNGIYDRTSSTVLTRSSDFDTPTEMAGGDFTFVTAGTLYDNTGWVMTDPVTTVGTSPVPWVQFSGAGTYTAGTGLTLTGTVFSVNASQTQITSVGTLGSLTVSGNASAGNLNTAGKVVASTLESNVATGTAPLTVTSTTRVGNLNVAYANVADFMNVTAPGTGTGYIIFANATTGNVAEWTTSGISSNLANNSITATTFVGALSGAATTAGTVTTNAQPNITSVGTLTSLGVNGTVTAVAFTANTGVFTGNGSGLSALAGANVTGQVANAIVAGTVYTAAQPNITSVGTLSSVTVSGNIVAQANVTVSGYTIGSVNAAVSAAGTVQGNATALTKDINVVSTVATGAGVVLPTAIAGMRVTIMNTAANALAVYPASGGKINSAATDASFSQAAGARLDFVATSATQWYTLNATYA